MHQLVIVGQNWQPEVEKLLVITHYLHTLIIHEKISLNLFGYSSLKAALQCFCEKNTKVWHPFRTVRIVIPYLYFMSFFKY